LLFDYGQRHRRELESAKRLARRVGCEYKIVKFALPWGGSSLVDKKSKLPVHKMSAIGKGRIPSTYVPARNTVFLSFALSWADAVGAENIVLGANALDYSGYPDCRPNYMKAFQKVSRLGTRLGTEKKRPLTIHAPLLRMTKAQIIRKGFEWGVPYGLTWSCYAGGRRPCGVCDSCRLRAKGFEESGIPDPVLVRAGRTN